MAGCTTQSRLLLRVTGYVVQLLPPVGSEAGGVKSVVYVSVNSGHTWMKALELYKAHSLLTSKKNKISALKLL